MKYQLLLLRQCSTWAMKCWMNVLARTASFDFMKLKVHLWILYHSVCTFTWFINYGSLLIENLFTAFQNSTNTWTTVHFRLTRRNHSEVLKINTSQKKQKGLMNILFKSPGLWRHTCTLITEVRMPRPTFWTRRHAIQKRRRTGINIWKELITKKKKKAKYYSPECG